jgi:DNA-binding PucR family transcriptional regulator
MPRRTESSEARTQQAVVGCSDPDEALKTILGRFSNRLEEIARQLVSRYQEEILDYRLADPELVSRDVYGVSLDALRRTVADLESGRRTTTPADFEVTRQGAARRVRQGMSLQSFLHAARLWGRGLWEAVIASADEQVPAEREAALRIAGQLLEHMDMLSIAAAQGYLDELQGMWSDREVAQRDLLDALIAGKGDSAGVRRLARSLRLRLGERYLVVLIRGDERTAEETPEHLLTTRAALRRTVEATRAHLRPAAGSLVVGVRHGQAVALYPFDEAGELDQIRECCHKLISDLAHSCLRVGISGAHDGLASLAVSYSEAREAIETAVASDGPRVIAFRDMLIDSIVRTSRHADRILDETIGPVLRYDADKKSELQMTLRAYVDSGFNLTKSAEILHVHPNTVVYRLRRVKELTGRDPHVPEDLLALYLGLKFTELNPLR